MEARAAQGLPLGPLVGPPPGRLALATLARIDALVGQASAVADQLVARQTEAASDPTSLSALAEAYNSLGRSVQRARVDLGTVPPGPLVELHVQDLIAAINSASAAIRRVLPPGAGAEPYAQAEAQLRAGLERKLQDLVVVDLPSASGRRHSLAELGVTRGPDGGLRLDRHALAAAYAADPEGVGHFVGGPRGVAAEVRRVGQAAGHEGTRPSRRAAVAARQQPSWARTFALRQGLAAYRNQLVSQAV